MKAISRKNNKMIPIVIQEDEEESQKRGADPMELTLHVPMRSQTAFEEDGREFTLLQRDFWGLYTKEKKLGEGTTGTVYKCKEVATEKTFAVKCVRTRDEELIFMVLFVILTGSN